MLTPDKIKAKEFQTTGRGSYRAEDVDAFLEEVYASYAQAFKENGEIIKKMSILANKVEEYKKDEDSLKQALLSAQKLADKIVSDAKQSVEQELADSKEQAQKRVADAQAQADKIVADAKSTALTTVHDAKKEAEDIIGGVNRKVTQETLVFEMLQKEVSAFKNKMKDMYTEHLKLLDRLPSIAQEEMNSDVLLQPEETATEKKPEDFNDANDVDDVDDVDDDDVIALDDVISEEDKTQEITEEPQTDVSEAHDGFSLTDIDTIDDNTANVLEDEDEDVVIKEDESDGFVVDSSLLDDEDAFEDVSSESVEEPIAEDGFSLDMSDVDFDEEEEDALAIGVSSVEYEPTDSKDDDSDDDDDDDGAISFKSFFKKK